MKEHPILFSTPMVKAILDGSKTMTRRVINPQPIFVGDPNVPFKTNDADPKGIINCPFGKKGDLLWVKERFCIGAICESEMADGHPGELYIDQCKGDDSFIPYEYAISRDISIEEVKWKPSIFMFKKDARIWLKVKSVKVEYLNAITREDIIKEGACTEFDQSFMSPWITLWDSINGKPKPGKPDISWNANPWVWVVEFERTDKPYTE